MKKFLPYHNKEFEVKETRILRFKSIDKLCFLKEPIYWNKDSGGYNFFGTETKGFSSKCQKIKDWSAQSDSDLLREIDTHGLIEGIASGQ